MIIVVLFVVVVVAGCRVAIVAICAWLRRCSYALLRAPFCALAERAVSATLLLSLHLRVGDMVALEGDLLIIYENVT